MDLYFFHYILIIATIAFDLWFSVWCYQAYQKTSEWGYVGLLIGSSVAAVLFVFYLFYFARKTRALRALTELHCGACDYDLRGSIEAGASKCPECGEPISEPARQAYEAMAS